MAENLKEIKSQADIKPFDSKAVLKAIDEIMAGREDVASANQGVGGIYKRLEKEFGIPRGVTSLIVTLSKKSDENREGFLESLRQICDAKGWQPKPTLFDATAADKASKSKASRRMAEAMN